MSLISLIAFAGAMLLLAMIPGPGVMVTIARALASGFLPAFVNTETLSASDVVIIALLVTIILAGTMLTYPYAVSRAKKYFARKNHNV